MSANMNNQTCNTSNLGFRWLFGAGFIAILFALFLFTVDQTLTHSKVEAERAQTIGTLRNAQTSLPSRVTDERQLRNYAFQQETQTEKSH